MTTETTTTPEAPEAPARRAKEPDPTCTPAEVLAILAFHGTPVAAQALREVLGQLGRAAAAASRRQPKNRPEPFGKWNPPHLRLLAELCAELAPEVGSIVAPTQADDLFPDATSPAPADTGTYGPTDAERQAVEVARIEAELLAKRAELAAVEATLSPNGYAPGHKPAWHKPDPIDEAALAAIPGMTDALGWTVPRFHKPDPLPADVPPMNADQARAAGGDGQPPF